MQNNYNIVSQGRRSFEKQLPAEFAIGTWAGACLLIYFTICVEAIFLKSEPVELAMGT